MFTWKVVHYYRKCDILLVNEPFTSKLQYLDRKSG